MSDRRNKHDGIATMRRDVFKTVYGVSRLVDVLKQFKKRYSKAKNKSIEDVQMLYRDYSYAIFFMYSPSAIRNNLVKFKKIIEEEGGKYKANALEAFTIDNVYAPIKERDKEVKKEYKKNVRAGKSESQNIDPQIVKDQIADLKRILKEKDYTVARNQDERQVRAYYILALLGLATGRRFTEIIKTLKMTKRGRKVLFSGLLKGNDEAIEGHIIPPLSYKEAKSYLNELRKLLNDVAKSKKQKPIEELTENEVNARYSRVFNTAIKKMGFTNVKALRHNYSIAGSQLFKREDETIEDTITRILGHRETFTSALNYA